jgi:SARP family transcriptional regulator, regulator of embCAB operon
MSTRVGRSPDNDIVLTGGKVGRHHAANIDTGSSFVIADLRSANGVYVRDGRIHTSATLADGDVIGIGDHKFIRIHRPRARPRIVTLSHRSCCLS